VKGSLGEVTHQRAEVKGGLTDRTGAELTGALCWRPQRCPSAFGFSSESFCEADRRATSGATGAAALADAARLLSVGF